MRRAEDKRALEASTWIRSKMRIALIYAYLPDTHDELSITGEFGIKGAYRFIRNYCLDHKMPIVSENLIVALGAVLDPILRRLQCAFLRSVYRRACIRFPDIQESIILGLAYEISRDWRNPGAPTGYSVELND